MSDDMPEEIYVRKVTEKTLSAIRPESPILLGCLGGKLMRTKYVRADLVPQWQPIETAPRDGTEIILYKQPNKQCNAPFWVIGKFVSRYELLPYEQCYKEDCCGDCPEPEDFEIKVLVTSWNHKDISSTGFTHWMPLPKPPTEKNDE